MKKIIFMLAAFVMLVPAVIAYASYNYDVVSVISSAIATDIIPTVTNTYNIGSVAKEWKNLYVRNAVISNTMVASGTTSLIGTSSSSILALTQNGTGPVATFMGGNVGIGMTAPGEKLEIIGNARISGHHKFIGTGTHYFKDEGGTTVTDKMIFRFSDDEDVLTIAGDGKVGIGTTTPQSLLSVGSVNDGSRTYIQMDSENGAPAAGDCDSNLERGRQVHDYTNFVLYTCSGATRGWDRVDLGGYRAISAANDATSIINVDVYKEYYLTAMSEATEISITGTPVIGQEVFIGLKDNGTTRALTWTGISVLGVTLPTTTTPNKQHIIKLKYIGTTWYAVAVSVEA